MQPPAPPSPQWVQTAKAWLFGGNLVAKVGLLILFVGLAFLLRLAAEHVTVPVEVRLTGVAALALALLGWGWKIRETRSAIGLPSQGAALAILMLVTFAAYRLFDVIPSAAAFACLLVLVVFTCLLAGLQNAMWLAIFGIVGGFVTPILTSRGGGSHIALFSYYALLNAGILALAWKKSWRPLNILGFIFTFIIGTAWGVLRYTPENYLSTQLFLVLFGLFYIAIAVLYALRQAPELKSYVDGTLVFGVPLAAMGLQYGLVKDMHLGMAFSALSLGLVYACVAALLWRWRRSTLSLLVESFMAMAIVFCTLCIPLALDGRWTSAAWALEGAAITWMGLRQQRPLAWRFGLLVQAGSWVAFIAGISGMDLASALVGNLWLGFLVLGLSAAWMARVLRQHSASTPEGFITMAVVWLLAGSWVEVWLRTEGTPRATLLVVSALALCVMVVLVAGRLQWKFPLRLAQAVFGLAGMLFVGQMWSDLMPTGLAWLTEPLGSRLLDGPLLGASLLCGGALWSALALKRRAVVAPTDVSPTSASAWLLVAAFWWFLFMLPPLSSALSWLSAGPARAEADLQQAWHYVSPWTIYALAVASTASAWLSLALRASFSNRAWMIKVFWPAVTVAGTALLAWLERDFTWRFEAPSLALATVQTPLWGALWLAVIWARGAWRQHQRTEGDFSARGEGLWLLGLGLVWFVGVCTSMAALLLWSKWVLAPGTALGLCVLLSAGAFALWAQRKRWTMMRWLATPVWVVQALTSLAVLATLYITQSWPATATWALWALAWVASACLLQPWLRRLPPATPPDSPLLFDFSHQALGLQAVHVMRVVLPWMTLIGALSVGVSLWMTRGTAAPDSDLGSWLAAGIWADYIAAWAGVTSLFVLLRLASRQDGSAQGWLLAPLQAQYRRVWIPLGAAWAALLVMYWNLRQDGSMAPLPYLPVLNPLDITTGSVCALWAALLMRQGDTQANGLRHMLWTHRMQWATALGFIWFNLILLRTASQWLGIPYQLHDLFASQFIQSMWSLVWSLSALVAMWWASRHAGRRLWMSGAALLGVVVLKLLLVDLSNVGSVARIVSFIGVGGLMLAIGYLAPMPSATSTPTDPSEP